LSRDYPLKKLAFSLFVKRKEWLEPFSTVAVGLDEQSEQHSPHELTIAIYDLHFVPRVSCSPLQIVLGPGGVRTSASRLICPER
jgi:hypothetical protein